MCICQLDEKPDSNLLPKAKWNRLDFICNYFKKTTYKYSEYFISRTIYYLYQCTFTYIDISAASWFPDSEVCNIPLKIILFKTIMFVLNYSDQSIQKNTSNNGMRYVENLWEQLMPKLNWKLKASKVQKGIMGTLAGWSVPGSVARASTGFSHLLFSFFGFCRNWNTFFI